jgi:hypothetical protein
MNNWYIANKAEVSARENKDYKTELKRFVNGLNPKQQEVWDRGWNKGKVER